MVLSVGGISFLCSAPESCPEWRNTHFCAEIVCWDGWNPMFPDPKTLQDAKSTGIHRNPLRSTGTHRIPLESVAIHRIPQDPGSIRGTEAQDVRSGGPRAQILQISLPEMGRIYTQLIAMNCIRWHHSWSNVRIMQFNLQPRSPSGQQRMLGNHENDVEVQKQACS